NANDDREELKQRSEQRGARSRQKRTDAVFLPMGKLPRKPPCLSAWLNKNQISMERTVLVVEDDRELAGVLADALSEYGYRVECAHDGAVAMARLKSDDRPAAIILDLL